MEGSRPPNDDENEEILDVLNGAKLFGYNDADTEVIRDRFTQFFGRRKNEDDGEDDAAAAAADDDDDDDDDDDSDEYSDDSDVEMESLHSNEEDDEGPVVVTHPKADILTTDDLPPMMYDYEANGACQNDVEYEKIRSFKRCRCVNHPCTKQFNEEFILERRMEICELSDVERKLFVMGHISSSINRGETTVCKKRKMQKDRVKTSCVYSIDNKKVCRESFQFIHCISNSQLTGILKSFKEHGVIPPRKKSGGRQNNKHALTFADIKHVVTFIEHFGDRNGYMLPGKTAGVRAQDTRIRLLPTSETKASVFRVYKQQMEEVNRRREIAGSKPLRVVRKSSFNKLWKQHLPFVKIMKPKSDVCWRCQRNNSAVYHSANATEAEKSERIRNQMEHLELVKRERDFYVQSVTKAKKELTGEMLGANAPMSNPKTAHYSFDYAQQVLYPADPIQPGPIYFIAQRKCGLFGIAAEGLTKQANYIIDESYNISKGSNGVIGYLNDFFNNFSIGEKDVVLNCDNCVGQNKNNFVMQYLAWRCIHNLHRSIYMHFMIAGHTKFSPDWGFGLVKQRFTKCFVSSLGDMVDVVRSSSTSGVNIPRLVGDEMGNQHVPSYNWQEFFKPYFRTLPHITDAHHFRFSSEEPGVVHYKNYIDSQEKRFQMLKDPTKMPPLALPEQLPWPAPKFNAARQWFLHDYVREYCKDEVKDLVCPMPKLDRPSKEASTSTETESTSTQKKANNKRAKVTKQK